MDLDLGGQGLDALLFCVEAGETAELRLTAKCRYPMNTAEQFYPNQKTLPMVLLQRFLSAVKDIPDQV